MIGFLDSHPKTFALATILLIAGAIFALPVALYVVWWDAIFVVTVLGINMIAPDSTILMAFFLGMGVLFRPLALILMSIYIVLHFVVKIIVRYFFPINIMAILFFTFAGFQQYGETSHSIFAFFGSGDSFPMFVKESIAGFLGVGIPLAILAVWAINNDMNKDDAPCAPPSRPLVAQPAHKAVQPVPRPATTQAPVAPVVQNAGGFDRAAWYAQLARENARHGFK